jgi:hypothetical protein
MIHNSIRPQTRMYIIPYVKIVVTKLQRQRFEVPIILSIILQGDQQENKSRVLPHLLFYQNVCLLIVAKLSLPCTVVLLVVYSPRFESNILIKMISLQW